MEFMKASAQNPQGHGGTDWTLIGSTVESGDGIVSARSATAMEATHKLYYKYCRGEGGGPWCEPVLHNDYTSKTSPAQDATFSYVWAKGTGDAQEWFWWRSDAPSPVVRARWAALEGGR